MSFEPKEKRVLFVDQKLCLEVDFAEIFGLESDHEFFFLFPSKSKLRRACSELAEVGALNQDITVRQILDFDFFLDSQTQTTDAVLESSLREDYSGASADRYHLEGFGDLLVFFRGAVLLEKEHRSVLVLF